MAVFQVVSFLCIFLPVFVLCQFGFIPQGGNFGIPNYGNYRNYQNYYDPSRYQFGNYGFNRPGIANNGQTYYDMYGRPMSNQYYPQNNNYYPNQNNQVNFGRPSPNNQPDFGRPTQEIGNQIQPSRDTVEGKGFENNNNEPEVVVVVVEEPNDTRQPNNNPVTNNNVLFPNNNNNNNKIVVIEYDPNKYESNDNSQGELEPLKPVEFPVNSNKPPTGNDYQFNNNIKDYPKDDTNINNEHNQGKPLNEQELMINPPLTNPPIKFPSSEFSTPSPSQNNFPTLNPLSDTSSNIPILKPIEVNPNSVQPVFKPPGKEIPLLKPLEDNANSYFPIVRPNEELPALKPIGISGPVFEPINNNPSTEANVLKPIGTSGPVFKPIELKSSTVSPTSSRPIEVTSSTLPVLTPVPLSEARDNANFGTQGLFKETCNTVDGEFGTCISVKECEPYVQLLQQSRSSAALNVLRRAHCGFDGDDPKVCCPLPGFPTAPPPPTEPITTTSTTTTTEAPQTPEPKTLDEIFVSSFPEPPVCGVSNASFSRVVGGYDAKLGDFPWMALLGYQRKRNPWLCGGSIITNRHVLTAAHCIHNHEKDLYVVRLGELDLAREDEGATPLDILIKSMFKHEGYSPNTLTNDIGVLLLDREVVFTDLIKPICIPRTRELRSMTFEDYNPFIAGWGDTEFRGPAATHLQALQLPVVTNTQCVKAYSAYKPQVIDQRVLCAGYLKGGKDACQGDSGGPLMQPMYNSNTFTVYFYQIGVVSYGRRCADAGFPGVYSRITHFIPWLEEKVLGHTS